VSEIVEGKPVRFGHRELVPVVQVESVVERRVFVGDSGLAGGGVGFVHLKPIAILERLEGGRERRIPIRDGTAQLMGWLLLVSLAIPLLMLVAVRAARRD
jgi:hypothetical protein